MQKASDKEGKKMIPWHAQSVEDVLDTFSVKKEIGLSSAEKEKRLQEYGRNELPKQPPRKIYKLIFSQFQNPLILILIVAALISAFFSEWLDVVVIGLAVLLNTVLGFVEEYRADRSLQALKTYLPLRVKVRREGKIDHVLASEVVPGDIMILAAGDRVTADARLIESQVLEVQEAALTGESSSVKKSVDKVLKETAVGDMASLVFAGTTVTKGRAEAVVVGTGLETEIGKITKLVLSVKDEKTPLQKQLASFARLLGVGIVALSTIVFFIGIFQGVELVEMFKVAVAITVSAVPEGLVVAVTVILAIGMQRILKKEALVRRLIAAETLGSVQVICADKTGTLTTGEMEVVEISISGKKIIGDPKDKIFIKFLQALYFTSGVVVGGNTREADLSGSQTEIAIMKHLLPRKNELESPNIELGPDLPFSSENKFSARIIKNNTDVLYAVGAPDILLKRADISDKVKKKLTKDFEEMVGRGLRVLAVAEKKEVANLAQLKPSAVVDVKILGFVGLEDPLRKDAAEVIEKARGAGLRSVMITGDHPETALSIAQKAGLEATHRSLITGVQLDEMTDDELADALFKTTVFARVSPHHKLRIVHAWQRKGVSVAMTGDGVNDAPALKAADIGIAFGSGTEVAKETADMVLLNNNFKTIVNAVREGRIIFDNLRKMIVYLLSDSFSEILLVIGALLFGFPLPILPAQILWINLITDGFPSIALTFEPGEKDIMKEPPRKKKEPILNGEMKVLIIIVGLFTDLALFGIYFYLQNMDVPIQEIRTFIFVALGIDSLLYVFAIRKFRSSIFRSHPFQNMYLIVGVFFGFLLLMAPLVIRPLKNLFEFTQLKPLEWGILVGMGMLQLVLIEIVKEIYNHGKRKRQQKKRS